MLFNNFISGKIVLHCFMKPGAGPPSNTLKKNSDSQKRYLVSLPPKPLLKIKKERNWQEIVILKMAFGVCHGL